MGAVWSDSGKRAKALSREEKDIPELVSGSDFSGDPTVKA